MYFLLYKYKYKAYGNKIGYHFVAK